MYMLEESVQNMDRLVPEKQSNIILNGG